MCELLNNDHLDKRPEVAIFVSATGYYGDRGEEELNESSLPGKGFLSETCVQWEQASMGLHPQIRKIHLRIGFVLDKEEGGFPKMILPIKLFIGAVPGSGKQYVSWIHIEDLIRMFEFFIKNENCNGVYNGTAPYPVTLQELIKKSADYLQRPLFLPNIPEFIIQMIMGEMSQLVLTGSKVLPEKILKEGFIFKYSKIEEALQNLLK